MPTILDPGNTGSSYNVNPNDDLGYTYPNKVDLRPGLIIIDDLEDSESVRSEEQRAKRKSWLFADVLNSIDRSKKDWRIIVIGTLLHEDSILANLMEDRDWEHVHLALCNDRFESNWPDFMSNMEVLKLADSFRRQGLIDDFYKPAHQTQQELLLFQQYPQVV